MKRASRRMRLRLVAEYVIDYNGIWCRASNDILIKIYKSLNIKDIQLESNEDKFLDRYERLRSIRFYISKRSKKNTLAKIVHSLAYEYHESRIKG